jgi:hypothetical protein
MSNRGVKRGEVNQEDEDVVVEKFAYIVKVNKSVFVGVVVVNVKH